jgi:hypothetical protein
MIREIHIKDFRSFRDGLISGVTDFFSIARAQRNRKVQRS